MVWKLQVTVRTRIGLAIILSLGLLYVEGFRYNSLEERLTFHSASGVAIYKTPMQYNFFNEADWSGRGSWYYIWQQ